MRPPAGSRTYWTPSSTVPAGPGAVGAVGAPAPLPVPALAAGAPAVADGRRPAGPGYFFAPTILTDVPPDSPVVTREQFGPVLPYRSLDEAVDAANGTGFGPGGSVWSTDPDRAEAVAERLNCGTAGINHHAEPSLAQPSQVTRTAVWA